MPYSIMLDAGHGGRDPGAVYQGRQEKDDTLRLTLAIGEILQNNGIDVEYTRTTDIYESPLQKAQEANAAGVDFSIRKLAEVPTLTLPNEWVSVEERLPTDERPVLVFIGYADTMTGFITTSSYFCFDANPHWQWDGLTQDEQKTLFWMPLPEPPGKEG